MFDESTLENGHFEPLFEQLRKCGTSLDLTGDWPRDSLAQMDEAGVYRAFIPQELGGEGWAEPKLLNLYLTLARFCLTSTFILTQRQAAVSRIVASTNDAARRNWLPRLLSNDAFVTVGISHLTTSRRHLTQPAVVAKPQGDGFLLNGTSTWVTGADHADAVVVGATLEDGDGRQLLVIVPTSSSGVVIPPPAKLVALSASHTGRFEMHDVFVSEDQILAGPVSEVMKQAIGARTGGLQTSALAMGLARAAIDFILEESHARPDLLEPFNNLRDEWKTLQQDLFNLAEGRVRCTPDDVRRRSNSIALRATQAALAAAKGAGFASEHPAGRWCREALFFLVWSCPPAVVSANLCELAGIT